MRVGPGAKRHLGSQHRAPVNAGYLGSLLSHLEAVSQVASRALAAPGEAEGWWPRDGKVAGCSAASFGAGAEWFLVLYNEPLLNKDFHSNFYRVTG